MALLRLLIFLLISYVDNVPIAERSMLKSSTVILKLFASPFNFDNVPRIHL